MSISITIDDTDVRKALKGMGALVNKQRKMMNDVGEVVQTRVIRCFETTTSPYGKKWAPLSKATKIRRLQGDVRNKDGKRSRYTDGKVKRKNFLKKGGLNKQGRRTVRAGFQPLSDKGLLRKIVYQASENGVEVGSGEEYAATHQFGRKITGKMFKGAIIPARPFLPTNGLPKAWKDEVLDTMKQHMGKAIRG